MHVFEYEWMLKPRRVKEEEGRDASNITSEGATVHDGVECDVCKMQPISGIRYKKKSANYDLCAADFAALDEGSQQAFIEIEDPKQAVTIAHDNSGDESDVEDGTIISNNGTLVTIKEDGAMINRCSKHLQEWCHRCGMDFTETNAHIRQERASDKAASAAKDVDPTKGAPAPDRWNAETGDRIHSLFNLTLTLTITVTLTLPLPLPLTVTLALSTTLTVTMMVVLALTLTLLMCHISSPNPDPKQRFPIHTLTLIRLTLTTRYIEPRNRGSRQKRSPSNNLTHLPQGYNSPMHSPMLKMASYSTVRKRSTLFTRG